MKRLFGGKKDPGPPPPSLSEATETVCFPFFEYYFLLLHFTKTFIQTSKL